MIFYGLSCKKVVCKNIVLCRGHDLRIFITNIATNLTIVVYPTHTFGKLCTIIGL